MDKKKETVGLTSYGLSFLSIVRCSDYSATVESAATATNINTNFFIFSKLFKSVKQSFVY